MSTDAQSLPSGVIVGLNKYSHDASCCVVDAKSGEILFSQAKERLSGRKHDGGAVGELVDYALESCGATPEDVRLVVSNNHHFRVIPFEKRIDFYRSINYVPDDYGDFFNRLPSARHMELSHHLAHAWSCVGTAPFSDGLIVVMDGMGES